MSEIKCPYDLNQFILGEPIFENPFPEEECEKRKYYGDCYHCFSTAIAARDHQLKASVTPQPKLGYISIDDVMSVFDDFMCGEVDEDGTEIFLEMLKDKAEGSEE